LALNGVKPTDVIWSVQGTEPELFVAEAPQAPLEPPHGTFNVPARFVELAEIAILHRNSERFALLYRLLQRLLGHHDLLDIATDADVARVGGMVKAGSLKTAPDGVTMHFVVEDGKGEVPVTFAGIAPDLFKEGSGVVAEGRMIGGAFVADNLLAKHDENYVPRELQDMSKQQVRQTVAETQ